MIRNNKGITMVSLIITIAVMMVIAAATVTISFDRFEINNLNKMLADIELLDDKVLNYYTKYNGIPVIRVIEGENENIKKYEGEVSFTTNIGDNDTYYIIDLEAMEGIALNYGKGYEYYKTLNPDLSADKEDIYIINEESHSIYYVKGIEVDGKTYHSNLEHYVVSDDISPTSPEIRFISGEQDEEGKFVSNVEIEITPGKDKLSGIAKTEYSINGKEWKDITEEDPDVVKKENNILEIYQSDGYVIKARNVDLRGNISEETILRIGLFNWDFAWICTETTDAEGNIVRKWDNTKYTPETIGDKEYVIIAKFYSNYTDIAPAGFLGNRESTAIITAEFFSKMNSEMSYELIIDGEGAIPTLIDNDAPEGEDEEQAWCREFYNYYHDREGIPCISYVTSAKIGKGITNIPNGAFHGAYAMEKLEIANTVTKIEANAMLAPLKLKSLEIPSSINIIEGESLNLLMSLEKVTVHPTNFNYNAKDGVLFSKDMKILLLYPNLKKTESYEIPEGVEEVDMNNMALTLLLQTLIGMASTSGGEIDDELIEFKNFVDLWSSKLKKITVPSSFNEKEVNIDFMRYIMSLEEIIVKEANPYYTSEDGILYNKDMTKLLLIPMKKKIEELNIKEGVVELGNNAIASNMNIKKIKLPSTITNLSNNVLSNIRGISELEEIVVDERNPYYTSRDGVLYNKDMTEIILWPAKKNIEELIIPEGIVKINQYTLPTKSENIKIVRLPSTVEEIDALNTFGELSNLETIIVDQANPYFTSIDGVLYDKSITKIVRYPSSKDYNNYIWPDTVTTIGERAFENNKTIVNLNLSSNIVAIHTAAFSYSEKIKTIVLPETITIISQRCFADIKTLESVIIPNSVTNINDSAFEDCSNLKEVTLPISAKVSKNFILGNYPFEGCTSIEKITLIGNIESIKSSDDIIKESLDANKIKEIIILDNVKYIYNGVFANCTSLEKLQIMKTADEIKAMYAYPWNVSGKIYDKDGNLVQ